MPAGKLAVTIQRVEVVTGETVPLRPAEARGEPRRDYSLAVGGSGDPPNGGTQRSCHLFRLSCEVLVQTRVLADHVF